MQHLRARRIALLVWVVVVLLIAFRAPLARALIAGALDLVSGSRIAFSGLSLGTNHLRVDGLTVRRGGDPLFAAERIDVAYDARDLLPGGKRRFGLRSIDVYGPRLTLVRHADGSFNISGHGGGGGAPGGNAAGTPLIVDGQLREGELEIVDPTRVFPEARHLSIPFDAVFSIDTGAVTRYTVRASYDGAPLTLIGRIDVARRYAMHRLRIPRIDATTLLNYVVNYRTARVYDAHVSNVDAIVYSFASGTPHFAGGATIVGGAMHVPGIRTPLRDIAARFNLFDGGIAGDRITATIAGLRARAAGGIYDWQDPALRIGFATRGPLRTFRSVFNFSQRLPLSGDVAVGATVAGPVGEPIVHVRVDSPRAAYGKFPIDAVSADLMYYNSSLSLVRATARYGPFAGVTRGGVDIGDRAVSQLFVDGNAPPGSVPFVAQSLPRVPLRVSVVLSGNDLAVNARGIADGAAQDESIQGLFRIDRNGDGEFGPFAIRQGSGSAAGAFYADRSAAQSGFWLDARHFTMNREAARPHLPGLPNLAPPDFGGQLDARLAGEGHPSSFRLAGDAQLDDLVVGRYRIGRVSANLTGSPDDLRASDVRAGGPWGTFTGIGAYDPARLALSGRYRGSLERLAQFTGQLDARGPLDAPVSLLLASGRTVVQSSGANLSGASVHGVPLSELRGTIAVDGNALRIYAASARVAGGTFAAAGSIGGKGKLGVTVAGVDAAALRRAGAPLERGRVWALGNVTRTGDALAFDGDVSVADAAAHGLALSGSSGVSWHGTSVGLRDGDVLVDGNFGRFSGHVGNVGRGPAELDLSLNASEARIAPLARLVVPQRHDVVGTFGADLHVTGTTAAPSVTGRLSVPEGSFQGQAFRAASSQISLDQSGLAAREGTVTVGSTRVDFSAEYRPGTLEATLSALHADLSDFDDLFDTGDTLDGRGHVQAYLVRRAGKLSTNAQAEVAGLRYLHFDFGDSSARWRSSGRDVTGTMAFGGTSGRMQAAGTLRLAPRARMMRLLQRSRFTGQATLRDFDLGTWLPLLGYRVPLAGRADADVLITGSLPDPQMAITANLVDGRYAKIPIDRLTLQANANLHTIRLASVALDLGSLQASGSGVIGLTENDPIALSIHATTSDIGTLGTQLTGAKLALTGAGESDLKVTGSRLRPSLSGGFYIRDATVQTIPVSRMFGQFELQGRAVELESAEVVFAKGRLDAAGTVPFTFSPFGFGPADTPVDAEITARQIDLENFVPLLPKGSTLQGVLDGRVGLSGKAGAPKVEGRLDLTGGAASVPSFETEPLTKIAGTLSFDRNVATLETLHAQGGGGTLDASGRVTLAGRSAFRLAATAQRLGLDLPAYGRGTIDGSVVFERAAGQRPSLSGSLALTDTVIPFSALSVGATGGSESNGVPGLVGPSGPSVPDPAPLPRFRPSLDLALEVTADRNVRVRSGNIDIGGTGALHVGGTLADPILSGELDSTGGTLTYFNTVFRVRSGKVTFDPDSGLVPNLDAVATTHVYNPDPNGFRNVSGSADITFTAKGPVTKLDIQLSSTPSYSREQILGLLLGAPALGANLFEVNGYPSGAVTRNANGQNTVGQQAFSIANAQFTRNLLAPFETQAAGALGLSDINVNVDPTGNVGVTARKGLGKFVNAIFSQTFGYPTRQSFGFEVRPNQYTAAQFTAFTTVGAETVYYAYPALLYGSPTSTRITAAQPVGGTSGFAFSLQLRLP